MRKRLFRYLPAVVWGGTLLMLSKAYAPLPLKMLLPPVVCMALSVAVTYGYLRGCNRDNWTHRLSESPPWGAILLLSLCLHVYLFSTVTDDVWFYLNGWVAQDGRWLSGAGLIRFGAWILLLTPLLLWRPRWMWLLLLAALVYYQYKSAASFMKHTGGIIYQFDHPAFMMRLYAFRETFPQWIYYNPFWNAGRAAPFILASGISSMGIVLYPFWVLGDILQVYTPVLALTFLVLVPLIAMGSVRLLGGRAVAVAAAGLFGLGVSQTAFKWAIHFGTIGASFAGVFLLPVVALLYRILWGRRPRARHAVLLIGAACLYLVWPPSAVMAIPLLPALLLGTPRLRSRRRLGLLALAAAGVLLFMLPYAWQIIQYADPAGFAEMKTVQAGWWQALTQGWKTLGAHVREAHPLLVFFGVAGIWFWPGRHLRWFAGVLLAGMVLIAGWGEVWKPQFQLARTVIPLLYVAIAPASLWVERLIRSPKTYLAPLKAALCALLILGGDSVYRWHRNRGGAPFRGMDPENHELAHWIRTSVPEGGRVMFAGPTVHGYGRAQVSFLPVLAGREMMACDYYNFSPKRVEYDYPPRAFRANDQTMLEFMELYNVTHVITYRPNWVRYYDGLPEYYERVHTFGVNANKHIWRVRREPAVLLRGQGEVQAGINRLTVIPAPGATDLVLRYHWEDRLTVEPPAVIQPLQVAEHVRFILLQPNGSSRCRIRYR